MLSYKGEIEVRIAPPPSPESDGTIIVSPRGGSWMMTVMSIEIVGTDMWSEETDSGELILVVYGELTVGDFGAATITGEVVPFKVKAVERDVHGVVVTLENDARRLFLNSDMLKGAGLIWARSLEQNVASERSNIQGSDGIRLSWSEFGINRSAIATRDQLNSMGWTQDPRTAHAMKDPGVVHVDLHPNHYYVVRMRDGVLIHVPEDMIKNARAALR